MTKQIHDRFTYQGSRGEALALNNAIPFSPTRKYGVKPGTWSTSNYRGFFCEYELGEVFLLKNLIIFTESRQYPELNGVPAQKIPDFEEFLKQINEKGKKPKDYMDVFPMQYTGLNLEIEFSGKILIGLDPKESKSGKIRYRQVSELSYDSGILTNTADITALYRLSFSGEPPDCWWAQEEYRYYHLINYSLMEMN